MNDLPPLPEFSTRLKMCINRDHLTDPMFLRAEIRAYAEDYARAALRAAIERVIADGVYWKGIAATQSDAIYRMTVERTACDKYLKEGETPAERMERDHLDSLALMGLLAKEKIRAERAEAERDDLALELHEERANSGRVHEALSRAELQLTAAHQLQREHTVQLLRSEAEVARLRQEIGQPLQAERDRDALRALLVDAKLCLEDRGESTERMMIARIDAALESMK